VEDATMHDEADRADIAASLAGNGEAFRRIVQRHESAIARRMRRFARDTATVEELVQDVFVEAYFSLGGFSAKAPFEHWLNRIATRVGYGFLKKRQKQMKQASNDIVIENLAATEPTNAEEASEALHRVLDRLSARDRLVITLLHLENRTVAETASQTGWTQTMVKVQAFRARSKLRKLLEGRL
jgi:RNA polymerase sigma-70 factor (ECF subfamily)